MSGTTGQRMQLPWDGNQRTEAEAKTESPNVADNGWQNESAPKDGHAVSGMTPARMAKGKGKRDRPCCRSPEQRSQSEDKKDGTGATKGNVLKGTSPSGEPNEPSCFSYLNGKCTNPSRDYWHPPESVKHKTDEGCKVWETSAFLHPGNEAPSKKSKKDQKSGRAIGANCTQWSKLWLCVNCHNTRLDLRTWDGSSWRRTAKHLREHMLSSSIQRRRKYSSTFGNNWDHLWEKSRVDKQHRNPNA